MIPAFVQRNLFVRRLQIWRLIFGVTQSTADVNDIFDTVRTSSAEEPEIQVCIVTFSNKCCPCWHTPTSSLLSCCTLLCRRWDCWQERRLWPCQRFCLLSFILLAATSPIYLTRLSPAVAGIMTGVWSGFLAQRGESRDLVLLYHRTSKNLKAGKRWWR